MSLTITWGYGDDIHCLKDCDNNFSETISLIYDPSSLQMQRKVPHQGSWYNKNESNIHTVCTVLLMFD